MKPGPSSDGSRPPATGRISQVFDLPIGSWTDDSGVAEGIKKRLPRRAVVVAVGPEILPMAVRWARRLESTVAVVRRVPSECAPSGFAVVGAVEGKSCLILLEGEDSTEGLPALLEALRAAGARPDFRLLAPPGHRVQGTRPGGASRAGGSLRNWVDRGGCRFSEPSPVSATAARRGRRPRDHTTAVPAGSELCSRAGGAAPWLAAE